MEIKIYGIEEEIGFKIDRMAKKHGLSRNKYLIGILKNHVITEEVKETEEHYEGLIRMMLEVMQHNSEVMEMLRREIQTAYLLEKEMRWNTDDTKTF